VYNSIKSKLDQLGTELFINDCSKLLPYLSSPKTAVPGEVHTLLIHFNNMEGFESLGPSKIYKIEKDKPIWQVT